MLLGAEMSPKIDEKMLLEGSWEALGCPWRQKGPVEPQKLFYAFTPRSINRLVERSWEGLGALLGWSWAGLGGLWGVSWLIFCALGRSWMLLGATSVAKVFPRAIFCEFVLLLGWAEPWKK